MTERKLEKSEQKSHEVITKWDDNPLFSHVSCSCIHSDGITERECCIENLTNSAEGKSNIFSDNRYVKKIANEEKSDEIDRENTKIEVTSMPSENFDCSNNDCIEIINQNVEGKQQITTDNKKSTEFSFSLNETDNVATDFSILQENKTEKSAQNIEYINKITRFTRINDGTGTCNLPKSKSHPLEITIQRDESDKDFLTSNFFCSSDDIIHLPKLEINIVKDAIPLYENFPEGTSSESDKDILSAKFSCSSDDIINLPKLESEVIKDAIPVYENTPESTLSESDKDILSSNFSCSSDYTINIPKLKNEVIKDASNDIINILQSESGGMKYLIPNSENIIESTSSSADQYHCNLDKNTESGNVIQDILKVTTEEKINENKKSILSIETDNLNTYIYAGEIKKCENGEQNFLENNPDRDITTDFQINAGVSDSDNRILLINENYELKQRVGSTEKIIGEKFPESNIIENSVKAAITEEQSTEYHGLLYSEFVTYLPESKHKIIKEKTEIAERSVPAEVGINENSITVVDYNRLQYDHSGTGKSTCKKKVYENILNVFSEEYDKSFESYTYASNTSFHIKEEKNSEKIEKIIYDHNNYKKDFYYNDSGDLVGENLISHDQNNSKNFHCTDSSGLNSVSILKYESELNNPDDVVQTKQKNDKGNYYDSGYNCHDKYYRMEIGKESHKLINVKGEGLCHSSDSIVSQTDHTELAMAVNKETEPNVLCDEDSWEDLSEYTTIHYNKQDQDMQHKVKTGVIGRACECEKSNDGMIYNEDSEYCETACYFTGKKKSFERKENSDTSWHETFSNGVSYLMNISTFRNYIKYISRLQNKMTVEETEKNRNFEDTNFTLSSNKVREISNEKCNSTKDVDTRETLISQICESRSQDIKTLEDALKYFDLTTLMEELEISLEEVRRRRKTKEAHELFLKDVDKQIQKLSFKFHPDRVRNKGGTEEEIETAQKLQAAINAVRSALNALNDAFLEDLDTDHRYGFYTKLELSSLANENEVKSHIYEVIFQIGLLSEIKQQKVIVEIQKFLFQSESCIQSYFAHNLCDFEKHRDLALLHLKSCIKGYKKLKSELEAIENEYKVEKLDNIGCSISRMVIENQKMLTVLRNLKRIAKKSLAGSFQIFTTSETLDEYFVLPFVCYMNVILMCNVMIQSEVGRFRNSVLKSSHMDCHSFKINGNISFVLLYSLVLYFIGGGQCEWLFKENMSKKESKEEFGRHLACLTDYFKDTFKACDYKYGSMRNFISEELKKCTKMMFDFKVKEKELSENIEKFKKKTEEIDKKYERIMKENEELNKLTQQQIENSKRLSELTSLATSEKF